MTSARTNVIIVERDPAVGRSLESLLQAAGYHARFRAEPSADELDELLADSCLLLIGPGLSTELRNALAGVVMRSVTKIPILELLPPNGGEVVGIQGADAAPWPCPMEELQRRIRTALLAQL